MDRFSLEVIKDCQSGATENFPSELLQAGTIFIAHNKEQHDELIRGGVCRPSGLPDRVPCIAQITASFGVAGGKALNLQKGNEIYLDRDIYVNFACMRYVRPVSEDVWSPDFIHEDDAPVRKFYNDEELAEKKKASFITKWRGRD